MFLVDSGIEVKFSEKMSLKPRASITIAVYSDIVPAVSGHNEKCWCYMFKRSFALDFFRFPSIYGR